MNLCFEMFCNNKVNLGIIWYHIIKSVASIKVLIQVANDRENNFANQGLYIFVECVLHV